MLGDHYMMHKDVISNIRFLFVQWTDIPLSINYHQAQNLLFNHCVNLLHSICWSQTIPFLHSAVVSDAEHPRDRFLRDTSILSFPVVHISNATNPRSKFLNLYQASVLSSRSMHLIFVLSDNSSSPPRTPGCHIAMILMSFVFACKSSLGVILLRRF